MMEDRSTESVFLRNSDTELDGHMDKSSEDLSLEDLDQDQDQDESSSCRVGSLMPLIHHKGFSVVQENGQRKFGGPPPDWEGPPPPRGCEVFVGKIPRDVYEDKLMPLFESVGMIYEFRLMMEFSGENRGYAFVMYTNRETAHRAIQLLDNHEICPGKFIGVCVSLDNCRLFVGSIPKDKRKEEIMEEMKKLTQGVMDVIVYPNSTDKSKNRGFAFIEYKSHKAAAMARRKLMPGNFQLWGQAIQVDWAEPERDVDEEVRNLMLSSSEETLRHEFSRFKPGSVERVKKLTDYAFVHYRCRDDAVAALRLMDGAQIDGATVEVTLAKPAGVRDGGLANRRYSSKEYQENGGGDGGGHKGFSEYRNNSGGGRAGDGHVSLPPRLRKAAAAHAHGNGLCLIPGDLERYALPLHPSSPLSPTSLLALRQSQIVSAVSLLDLHCCKHGWSRPEYHLFSTPGPDGQLLLLYKVVIQTTQSTYAPDKLCALLDDAKELAAQITLWNLDSSLQSSFSCESPPGLLSPATTPGLRTFSSSCLPLPPSPASLFPLPPPFSMLTPPSSLSLFY